MKEKIGFIGLGLIGGSIAKAIRQYYPDFELVAFDKQKETLALAAQEGIIDTACSSINDSFCNCTYLFLCAPVAYNNAYLAQLKTYLHEGCILTDVGSVKNSIHEAVKKLELEEYFIGGHPMAGSEKSGFANAKAILIENAYFVLTPSEKVSQEKVTAYKDFIASLKAIPIIMNAKEHDFVTGTISHLPHIIASGLVNFVEQTDTANEYMKLLAAGGFKDITRIASSSPTMWQHICLKNHKQISEILDAYIHLLIETKKSVETCNTEQLYDFFDRANNYRNSIPDSSFGCIKKEFVIYCDIIDTSYDKNTDTYIFTDLLADVIIENDGFVRVVDLDELADACRMSIISNDMLVTSLHRLNALLSIIYNGDFKDYLDELERYEVLNPALNHLSKLQ